MHKHEPVYVGAEKLVYESRCACGWTVEKPTAYEAREAFEVHMHRHASGQS